MFQWGLTPVISGVKSTNVEQIISFPVSYQVLPRNIQATFVGGKGFAQTGQCTAAYTKSGFTIRYYNHFGDFTNCASWYLSIGA